MLVDLSDGKCRSCGGQLKIVAADDATMDVECQEEECLDSYTVEIDAFEDGGIKYWPQVMADSSDEIWE